VPSQFCYDYQRTHATINDAVNEPWRPTPLEPLKQFYKDSYDIIRTFSSDWLVLFHDSFRPTLDLWTDLLTDCESDKISDLHIAVMTEVFRDAGNNCAIDMHLYQAWFPPMPDDNLVQAACIDGQRIQSFEDAGVAVIVGEWSLGVGKCTLQR
jgi:hypothetical protein